MRCAPVFGVPVSLYSIDELCIALIICGKIRLRQDLVELLDLLSFSPARLACLRKQAQIKLFHVKNREGKIEKYSLFENLIDEIKIKSGNFLSSGALASCGFWGIDCLFLTQKGKPVAMLRTLDDDSHVKTRISQYEASRIEKGNQIVKQFVLAKLEGQNQVLKKARA